MQSKEKTKSTDDSSLVAALQNNDNNGYEQLYDRYAMLMFGVIRRVVGVGEDAENLLQDSFIKIWRNIETYDASKGKFSTWILNIARNTAIDFYRSKAFSQQRKNQNLENLVEPKMIFEILVFSLLRKRLGAVKVNGSIAGDVQNPCGKFA